MCVPKPVDKGERELRRDLKQLLTTWKRLQKQGKKSSGPKLLHKEIGMTSGLIRDLFTEDVHRLFIDSKREYKEIQAYLKGVSPELRQTVEYYGDTRPIFDAFGIEAEIEKLTERKIWFKGGGYLVIDPTEALVAIDVNSGRSVGKGRAKQDETVLKTNLEAAREVARQLRLRDMGGLVVVDFIDMNHARDRKRVEDEMHQGIRRDRSKIRYSRHYRVWPDGDDPPAGASQFDGYLFCALSAMPWYRAHSESGNRAVAHRTLAQTLARGRARTTSHRSGSPHARVLFARKSQGAPQSHAQIHPGLARCGIGSGFERRRLSRFFPKAED